MKITRMDLDTAGSPMALVAKIFKIEPDLPVPIPVEELAHQLDIIEIIELTTQGYDGGLLTQPERASGIILVKKGVSPTRRRFTIAHELGHFLLASHTPVKPGEFLCRQDDMLSWDGADQDRYKKMEAEANLFAALLLMPPALLRKKIETFRDPSLEDIESVADHFAVSFEAAGRNYVEHHGEPISLVIVKDQKVYRIYRNRNFPYTTALIGRSVPVGSSYHNHNGTNDLQESGYDAWCDKEHVTIYEQVQTRGDYSYILLWAEIPEDEE